MWYETYETIQHEGRFRNQDRETICCQCSGFLRVACAYGSLLGSLRTDMQPRSELARRIRTTRKPLFAPYLLSSVPPPHRTTALSLLVLFCYHVFFRRPRRPLHPLHPRSSCPAPVASFPASQVQDPVQGRPPACAAPAPRVRQVPVPVPAPAQVPRHPPGPRPDPQPRAQGPQPVQASRRRRRQLPLEADLAPGRPPPRLDRLPRSGRACLSRLRSPPPRRTNIKTSRAQLKTSTWQPPPALFPGWTE
ncbi:hypothetical protein BC628DRAFT_969757 [Trametes gibbosa]|nr:hypothetical protein BC628DRAFT_969032 [Trametes gibbosa]KAI0819735.1 hypothetical protein BC628DRAFT_969757 [Trametes gibbosa]